MFSPSRYRECFTSVREKKNAIRLSRCSMLSNSGPVWTESRSAFYYFHHCVPLFSFSLSICLISAINCSLFVFIARRIAVIYFSSKKLHAFRHCYFLCINGRKIHINSFTVISILVVAESGVCKSVHIWRSVELILSDFLFITMLDTELNHREQFENRKSSPLNRMKWEGISWIKYLKLNASCFIIYSSF